MGKKIIAILTAVFMMATLFTGCLSAKKQPEPKDTQPQAQKETKKEENNASKDVRVLKISNGITDKHPAYKAQVEVFKKIVEEKTNGRYKIEVYHSNQLGDDTKATEALRAGTLEMCVTSTAPLVGLVPDLTIFDLPFLFPDEKAADTILDGPVGQMLSDEMPKVGVYNLAWWENGFRHLTNSVRDVKSIEDLKGLKIRTMENKVHLAAWRALGANPTPMSWSEVFTALKQGAIDGQENPIPNIYSSKIQEVNKHITLTGHVYSPFMFLFSKKIFDTLPAEDQKIIREAAIAAGKEDRRLNREATIKNMEDLKKEGVTIIELSPEQKKAFKDATAKVWDEFGSKINPEIMNRVKEELAKLSK